MTKNAQYRYIAYRYNEKIAESTTQRDLSDKTGLKVDQISSFKRISDLGYELVDLRPEGNIEIYDIANGSKITEFALNKDVAEYFGVNPSVIGNYCSTISKGYEIHYQKIKYDYIAYRGDDVICVAESLEELSKGTGMTVETLRRYASHPKKDYETQVYRYAREEE